MEYEDGSVDEVQDNTFIVSSLLSLDITILEDIVPERDAVTTPVWIELVTVLTKFHAGEGLIAF